MKVTAKTILILFLAILFGSCSQSKKTENSKKPTVKIAKAQPGNNENSKEFTFISKPFRSSELSFRVGGPIDQFEVYAGNFYKRGEIIAGIDSRDFHIRKERTEATYKQAEAEFERTKTLYEKDNISASTFEKVQADYISAKTAYETALNELNDTKLIAPFNGYVGEVYIEKYQDVKATQPIISLVDIDQLKIETYVPQEVAFQAQDLKTVHLQFDAIPNQSYKATIVEISKSTTPNNLSYLLTALLPNPDGRLLAGMSGKLSFNTSSSDETIIIPQTALCHRPTVGNYVWVINTENQKVSQRKVIPGPLLSEGKISIKQGLKANESVAISGLRFLSAGMDIEISQDENIQ